MIASLTGEIQSLSPNGCIIRVGGVGYSCSIPFSTYREINGLEGVVTLWTHTHVRQDIFALYGFFTAEERDLFRQLISVNGVGPKVALCLLSGLNPKDLVEAIQTQNRAALAAVPGIGPKTADRILFELRGKVTGIMETGGVPDLRQDAVSALVNLGYRSSKATKAVNAVLKEDRDADMETILVQALQVLAR